MTKKVMVVDDSSFMRNHISKFLTQHGYEIVVAENGEEAVRHYRAKKPDVVLMDITMPQMDGMDALVMIREFDPRAKVIMLSALGQRLIVQRAIHIGAKDFLVKPIPPQQLLLTVQKALR